MAKVVTEKALLSLWYFFALSCHTQCIQLQTVICWPATRQHVQYATLSIPFNRLKPDSTAHVVPQKSVLFYNVT